MKIQLSTALSATPASMMIMGAHEALSRDYGVRPPVALRLVFEEYRPLDRAREVLEVADFEAALERGRRMGLEDVVELIAGLEDGSLEQTRL